MFIIKVNFSHVTRLVSVISHNVNWFYYSHFYSITYLMGLILYKYYSYMIDTFDYRRSGQGLCENCRFCKLRGAKSDSPPYVVVFDYVLCENEITRHPCTAVKCGFRSSKYNQDIRKQLMTNCNPKSKKSFVVMALIITAWVRSLKNAVDSPRRTAYCYKYVYRASSWAYIPL